MDNITKIKMKCNETQMKFGDVEVTTRALGACLQGSRVQIEEGVLHLWRVSDSKRTLAGL